MLVSKYMVKGRSFDESEHPRDGDGRFTRKPGGDLPHRGGGGGDLPRRGGGGPPDGGGSTGGGASDAPRPKVGDVIPTVGGQRTPNQLAELHQQVRQVVEGEFAGFRTQLTGLDADRDFVNIQVSINRDGVPAGETEWTFSRVAGGALDADLSYIRLAEPYRRKGFASAFNKHMTEWLRESGVRRITLQTVAGLPDGGYAWASAGFDWEGDLGEKLSGAPKVIDKLRTKLEELDEEIEELQDTLDALPDDFRRRTRMQQRLDQLQFAADAAGELLARADHYEFKEPGYPTPYEISQLGRLPGQRDSGDPDEWWFGKRIMMGTQWSGEYRLDGEAEGEAQGKAARKPVGDRAAMLREMAAVHDEWVAEHLETDPAAADDPGAHEEYVQRIQAMLDRHRGEESE